MSALQLLEVRRRLLAWIHADLIELSIRTHGWDRNDITCALAHAGSWERLEQLFRDWQRTHTVHYANSPDAGQQKGRRFYGFVLAGGLDI